MLLSKRLTVNQRASAVVEYERQLASSDRRGWLGEAVTPNIDLLFLVLLFLGHRCII